MASKKKAAKTAKATTSPPPPAPAQQAENVPPWKRRRGPSKLTPEVRDAICSYVNAGATIPRACEAAGISWNTAKDWLKLGRDGKEGHEVYADFVESIRIAKAAWESAAAMRITGHGKKDWRAMAWMLERRNPKDWSPPKNQHEFHIQVNDKIRLLFERLRAVLPDTFTFDELLAAVAQVGGESATSTATTTEE